MWGESKPMLKSRGGGAAGVGDDESDYFPPTPRKDWSTGLLKLVTATVIFMAGVVIGLSVSGSVARYYYNSHAELFFPATTYGCDRDRDCGLGLAFKAFVHPQHLAHSMSDEELFWRASLVPKTDEFPFQRVPKVAFLFMTRGPLPFAPLWDKFFRGHQGLYSVYVHTLPDYKLNVSKNSAFYGRQIPSEEVSWGSITLVDAEKRLLANALLDFSNERFVLLSESCIPLFNFPTIYEYLINSAHSFVESYNIDTPQSAGRYNRRMAPHILPDKWRKGSEWFELNRELAVQIVADHKYYSIFRKHCRPSCYPDEHYIPTYLHLFHGSLNANRTITWVDWSRGGPHPARYGASSISEGFIQAIRNNGTLCTYNSKSTSVCYLFARKFAPSALGPLMNLTSTVLDF
ncbi:glycosyltransferase BC10-like [Phragmites australis]|uniref:glycosyltransferase BC10-like n=1 Tax=Phragmites australis TaxID=29695 RepID=UPI002D767144|nr:glycosyltransferase BC10-like [Phragmites australis]XP_062191428.1 glycosyltransferase BC10-like [Phragmites australis]